MTDYARACPTGSGASPSRGDPDANHRRSPGRRERGTPAPRHNPAGCLEAAGLPAQRRRQWTMVALCPRVGDGRGQREKIPVCKLCLNPVQSRRANTRRAPKSGALSARHPWNFTPACGRVWVWELVGSGPNVDCLRLPIPYNPPHNQPLDWKEWVSLSPPQPRVTVTRDRPTAPPDAEAS